tara:strand:+ start:20426 stop:20845 length:420 start_codon:yes stop_codon:yes gene_type:complete
MKEYSFLDTLLLLNGVEISGFDEGDDVISLDRLNDSATHKIGTDGEMTVSISADRSGTMTFRLMQSSDSNIYLSGLITAQENGAFVPIFAQFADTKGLDLGSGTQGYITKPAPMVRGTNANSQEWVVVVERLNLLHGLG